MAPKNASHTAVLARRYRSLISERLDEQKWCRDDPAGRRHGDGLDLERSRPRLDRRTQALRLRRTLKDLELLLIQRRVAPRGEDEVPLTERTRLTEDPLHVGRHARHRDYSARG